MPSPSAKAAPSSGEGSEIWDDPDEATRKLSSQDIARTLGSATDLEMDWDEDDSATHMYESEHAQVIMPAPAKPAAAPKAVTARPTSSVRPRTQAREPVRAEVLDPNLAFPELKKADPATKDALADLPPVPQLKAVPGAARRASAPTRETRAARAPRAPRQTMERPIARPRTITAAPSLRYPTYESQSPMSAALHPSAATRPTSGARIPTLQWAPTALVPSYAPQPQVEEDEDDAWAAAWEHAERAIAADETESHEQHAYAEQAYAQQPQAYAQQPQAYAQQPQAYAQQPQAYAQQPQAYAQQPQAYAQQPQANAQPQTMHGYAQQPSAQPAYDPHAYAQPYTQQPAFASPAPQVRQVTHRRADGPTMTSFPPSPVRYDQYGRTAYDGPTLGPGAAAPAVKPRLPKPMPAPAPVSYRIDEKPFARRSSILGPLFWSVIPGSALFGAVLWGRVLLAGPEAAVPPVASSEPTPITAPAAAAPAPAITPTVTPEPLPSVPAASTAAAAVNASKSKRSHASHDDDTSSSSSASRASRSRASHDDSDSSSSSASRSSRASHDSDKTNGSSTSRSSRSSHDSSSDIAAAPPTATRTREDFDTEPKSSAKESKGGIGILRLNSRPWSQVSVDGKPVGNTPQMGLRLSAGTHQISLVNPQMGMSKKFKVEVQADQIVTRVETLED